MPKYFLDCGAHDGCSIRLFRKITPDINEYSIHCFEPNPLFRNQLFKISDVIFHQEAVWIEDCEAPFYLSHATRCDGSTLLANKTSGQLDYKNPIMVRCVNFGQWLQHTFQNNDYLVVKFDIEGAEYAVLRSMIDDGSIHKIAKLYIEFHHERIGLSDTVHDCLMEELKATGLEIAAWDALGK
jgi:FkbM family methyltransferase